MELYLLKISDFIKRYKNVKQIKIYFLIGKYSPDFGFEEHLFSGENYNKIKNLLDSCTSWEEKNSFVDCDKTRHIIDYVDFKYNNSPYDFRLVAESLTGDEYLMNNIKETKFNNYNKKNHGFVLMKHKYDDIDYYKYSFKLEILNKINCKDTYTAESSLCKIKDVINACEKLKENSDINIID